MSAPALVRIIQNPPAVYPRVIIKFRWGGKYTPVGGSTVADAIANVRRLRLSWFSPLSWRAR